jgi:hypothetical protein
MHHQASTLILAISTALAGLTLTACVGDAVYTPPQADSGNPDTGPQNDSGLPDGAVCTDGQADCTGQTPRTCVGGQWQTKTACSGASPICVAGACGVCNPNDTQCNVNTIQKCDSTGHWQDQSACADPTPTCKGGTCVCNLTVCGSTCTDMTMDAKNCGACGHDCQGGLCTAGVCQDITLASSQVSPGPLATDGTNVYFGTTDSVKTVPVGGGSTAVIAASLTSATSPWYLAIDSTNVYWGSANGANILTCLKSAVSCTPSVVVSGVGGRLQGLAVDGSNVYWTLGNPGSGKPMVQQCSKTSCTTPTVLTNMSGSGYVEATGIAVDGSNVYWAHDDGTNFDINVCAIGGCSLSPTVLISNQPASWVAVDGTNVYWLGSAVGQCDKSNPSKCNSTMKTLASGQTGATGLAVDGTSVFWSNSGGSGDIRSCKIGGCGGTPTVRASGPGSTSYAVALDTNSIFWTNNGGSGSVMQIAK